MRIIQSNIWLLFTFLTSNFLFNKLILAQTTTQADNLDNYAQTIGLILLIGILLMFIIFIVYSNEKYKYTGEKIFKRKATSKFVSMITHAVPVEKGKDIMFAKVPPWFNILFYGTIVFAVIYLFIFYLKPSMIKEYSEESSQKKQEELLKSGALINENTVILLKDPESLQNGKTIFQANCIPCHGQNGEGNVGPNLTDEYWIHGGGINNVFKTIKIGVPEKGMISWQSILSPKKIQEVASYVISLQGTNPPNGKPPEGQLWIDTTSTNVKKDSVSPKSRKLKMDSSKVKLSDSLKSTNRK